MTRRELLMTVPLIAQAAESPRANYIAINARSREVLVSHWPDANVPVPVGSLVKPFLAMAFGADFPEFECTGKLCWRPQGHGRLAFRAALAQSCNAYFLNLARNIDQDELRITAAKFGITAPALETPEARIGLGDAWRIEPIALANAYLELAARRGELRVNEILAGLALAASSGTAKAIGSGSLAKTGTATCVERRSDSGDGFAVVLHPAQSPKMVILVRVHNVPGAEAAKTAARLARSLRGA